MPDLDDQQFENYLRQFRPLMPDGLPADEISRVSRRRFIIAIWALGAIAIVVWAVASLLISHRRVAGESNHFASVHFVAPAQLTLRDANALLATAPSYKTVMNELAFPPKSSSIPKDKLSALAVLGKEKIKL
jgi:hypothetical protein